MLPKTPEGWEHLLSQAIARCPKGKTVLESETVEVWYQRGAREVLWIYAGGDSLPIAEAARQDVLAICRLMPVRPRTDSPLERSYAPAYHPKRSDAYELAMRSAPVRSATLRAMREALRTEKVDLGEFLASKKKATP